MTLSLVVLTASYLLLQYQSMLSSLTLSPLEFKVTGSTSLIPLETLQGISLRCLKGGLGD